MTAQPKATIKSYFEAGDKPTQAQFGNLIDSYQDITTSLTSLSNVVSAATSVQVIATNGPQASQLLTAAALRTAVGAPGLADNNTFTGTNTFSNTSIFGATVNMSGAAFNAAAFVDVASASTTDIGAAASNNVRITGTTSITSFGTASAGVTRRLRFAAALTLTYNGTSLILPTSANIVTAADDTCTATSLGGGDWVVTQYQRANGAALQVYQSSIAGLLISSIAGNATTASLSVSAGQATDSTNTVLINSSGALSWAASNGNAANGYQGGTTLPNSDTIHIFVISGPSGVASFAHNGLTPTLPSGYTAYRRVGSFNTTGAGAPIPYTAIEAWGGSTINYLTTQVLDVNSNVTTTAALFIMSVPTDIKVAVLGRAVMGAQSLLITSPDETDVLPTASGGGPPLAEFGLFGAVGFVPRTTNTSGQLRFRLNSSNSNAQFVTAGWNDFRR